MQEGPDPRADLARLVASVRAYVEAQIESGAHGAPRGPRAPSPTSDAQATPAAPEHVETQRSDDAPRSPSALPPEPSEAVRRGDPIDHVRSARIEAKPPAPAEGAAPAPAPARPLPVVRDAVAACRACRLAETRTQTVFARGNPEASIVFVGEAPGADEDAQGVPFVGRAGQLLDKMIVAMGLSPERDVYVCNVIKCRPPGNRRPEPDELDHCMPFLEEQLEAVRPRVMVAMGNSAVAALFGTRVGITRMRGEWKLYKGRIPTMPTYHPSYLLRPSPTQAEAKRQVWGDLQAVMRELTGSPARR